MVLQPCCEGLQVVLDKVDKEQVDRHASLLGAKTLFKCVEPSTEKLPDVRQHLHFLDWKCSFKCGLAALLDGEQYPRPLSLVAHCEETTPPLA